MNRIGILGGTFNPVHLGHLVIAQKVLEKFPRQKVLFVPSYRPPHKRMANLVPARHRFEMVRLAIQGNPHFCISDFEIKREQKSYSIDTVTHFKTQYPSKTRFYFIVGGDSAPGLSTWKRIDELAALMTFIVVSRPRYDDRCKGVTFLRLDMPGIDISSSYVRRSVKQGQSIQYLVPDHVMRYIQKHRFYRS